MEHRKPKVYRATSAHTVRMEVLSASRANMRHSFCNSLMVPGRTSNPTPHATVGSESGKSHDGLPLAELTWKRVQSVGRYLYLPSPAYRARKLGAPQLVKDLPVFVAF